MPRNRFRETRRHEVKRCVPGRTFTPDNWMEQTVVERQRFAERRTLGAHAALVGRVFGITCDCDVARLVSCRDDAAADAAIGAGGAHARHVSPLTPRAAPS